MAVIHQLRMVATRSVIKVVSRLTQQILYLYLISKVLLLPCPRHKKANSARAPPHDLFQIQTLFDAICNILKTASINLKDLFLKADSGFDSKEFREACQKEEIIANLKANPRNSANQEQEPYQWGTHIFDDELYKDRSVIEHANAWIDGFKALLVRFEFSVRNCGAARADGFAFYRILSHFFKKNQ